MYVEKELVSNYVSGMVAKFNSATEVEMLKNIRDRLNIFGLQYCLELIKK